jgi:NADH-quinone oxidoreductase subunit E
VTYTSPDGAAVDPMLSEATHTKFKELKARYPDPKSAVMPMLYLAQEEHGRILPSDIEEIAAALDTSAADVEAVATFYNMYYVRPTAKYVIEVCTNISCMLAGSGRIVKHLEGRLGIAVGQATPDGMFMLKTAECLGSCGTSPMMMIGDTYYENLTTEKVDRILDGLAARARDG